MAGPGSGERRGRADLESGDKPLLLRRPQAEHGGELEEELNVLSRQVLLVHLLRLANAPGLHVGLGGAHGREELRPGFAVARPALRSMPLPVLDGD